MLGPVVFASGVLTVHCVLRRAGVLASAALLGGCSVLAPSDEQLMQRAGAGGTTRSDAGFEAASAPADSALEDWNAEAGSDASSDAAIDPGDAALLIPKTNLLLWLMADKGVVHNATAVWQWQDQSGNELHASQSVQGSHPHLWTSAIGGLPALDFDGSADMLALAPGFADFRLGVAMFAVVRPTTLEGCGGIIELSNGSEIDDLSLYRSRDVPGYEVYEGYTEGGFSAVPVNTPLLISALHGVNERVRVWVNRQLWVEDTFALPTLKERRENFVGRSLYDVCGPWAGRIGEIVVYNRALDDDERARVESYLQTKWGCCK
jgi:hypothetical protein